MTKSEPYFCDVAIAMCIGPSDDLTDATARMILYHNKTGQNLCQWSNICRSDSD